MPLIASWFTDPANWLFVLEAVIGLGLVIFIHELGHFAVAKLCGVKCEKFYLGFDIYGLKLLHWRWGETEYGVGILPLGGYVKMLGQDDNPSKAAEERERSMSGQGEELDPRSYLAQSVPKRMAIISAGVIMNVIFAFALSAAAYSMGVEEEPCIIGGVVAGETAWRADLRTGDRVIEIDGLRNPRFRDLRQGVVFGSRKNEPVTFVVQRAGESKPLTIDIVPDLSHGTPTIGVAPPRSAALNAADKATPLYPVWDESLNEQLKPGDRVTHVAGKPVESYAAIKQALTFSADQPLELTISRKEKADASRVLNVRIPTRPTKDFGLIMEFGPISAVQDHSPAKAAGVEPGDVLAKVDGQPVGNPLSLPERLAEKAGKKIVLSLRRGQRQLEIPVESRTAYSYEQLANEDSSLGLPSLGLAFPVTTRVAEVGPELAGKVARGDEITQLRLLPPQAAIDADKDRETTLTFEGKPGWPLAHLALQEKSQGTKIELSLKGKDDTVVYEPKSASDWFNPDRGLNFDVESYTRKAETVKDDLALAARETKESVTQVYAFLGKLASREVSPTKGVGGPLTILRAAWLHASAGVVPLLLFLAMLSANLAVINFLPIPLLDGGHMAFLILEGIRGKPVSERVVVAFHYAGFLFIIGLMLFVITLDIQRLSR